MVTVIGHWDIGYMTPIVEQYYWSLPLRDFEVDRWIMNPVSGIRNLEFQVDMEEYETYDECFKNVDDKAKRVFIEPRTKHMPDTIWLHDFKHPEDVVYVLGSAHFNPTLGYRRDGDEVISIKTIQDKGVLWANQCITMVLYDRMVKSWQLQ